MATWAMPLKGGAWLSDWAFAEAARTIASEAMREREWTKLILERFCRVMRYSVISDEEPLSPMQVWGCTRTLAEDQRRARRQARGVAREWRRYAVFKRTAVSLGGDIGIPTFDTVSPTFMCRKGLSRNVSQRSKMKTW